MRRLLLLAAVAVIGCGTPSAAAPPLGPQDVERVRALVKPTDGEDPFATIPWETSLWAARTKAAAAGKPILLWEMDGHPLGCG